MGNTMRNAYGPYEVLTDDELKQKILDLAEELGHPPLREDFRVRYKGKYLKPIHRRLGGWREVCSELFGITPAKASNRRMHDPDYLLGALRSFYARTGRNPSGTDFAKSIRLMQDGQLPPSAYFRYQFGTLNEARLAAGLKALVHRSQSGSVEPKPPMEFTAEEYRLYLKGDVESGIITKQQLKKRLRYRAGRAANLQVRKGAPDAL